MSINNQATNTLRRFIFIMLKRMFLTPLSASLNGQRKTEQIYKLK